MHAFRAAFKLFYMDIWVLATACLLGLVPPLVPSDYAPGAAVACCLLAAYWAQLDGVREWFPRFLPAWAVICGLFVAACLQGCVQPEFNPLLSLGPYAGLSSGAAEQALRWSGALRVGAFLALVFVEFRCIRRPMAGDPLFLFQDTLVALNALQIMLLVRSSVSAPLALLAASALSLCISYQVRPRRRTCECTSIGPACGDDCIWHRLTVEVQYRRLVTPDRPTPQPPAITPDGYLAVQAGAQFLVASSQWLESIEEESWIRYVGVSGVPFLANRVGALRHRPGPALEQWENYWVTQSCADWVDSQRPGCSNRGKVSSPDTEQQLMQAAQDVRAAVTRWVPTSLVVTLVFLAYKILLVFYGDPTGWGWSRVLPFLAAYAIWAECTSFRPQGRSRPVDVRCLWMPLTIERRWGT